MRLSFQLEVQRSTNTFSNVWKVLLTGEQVLYGSLSNTADNRKHKDRRAENFTPNTYPFLCFVIQDEAVFGPDTDMWL